MENLIDFIINTFKLINQNILSMYELYEQLKLSNEFKKIVQKYLDMFKNEFGLTQKEIEYLNNLQIDDKYKIIQFEENEIEIIKQLIDKKVIVQYRDEYYVLNVLLYEIIKLSKLENIDFNTPTTQKIINDETETTKKEDEYIFVDDIDNFLLKSVKESIKQLKEQSKVIDKKIEELETEQFNDNIYNVNYDDELDEETKQIFQEIQGGEN